MPARQILRTWALSTWLPFLYAIAGIAIVVTHALSSSGGITLLWALLLTILFVRYMLWRSRELSERSE